MNSVSEDPRPTRICPQCSAQSQASGDTCPYCGASLIRSRRLRIRRRVKGLPRRLKFGLLAVFAVLLIGGTATGILLKLNHDNAVAAQHKKEAAERAQAEAEAREKQKRERAAQKAEETVARIEREDAVRQLETAITKDAEKHVGEEVLEGPILKTSCEPEGGELDVTAPSQDFSCMAVTSESEGQAEGYRYSATENFAKGNFTWRLGG